MVSEKDQDNLLAGIEKIKREMRANILRDTGKPFVSISDAEALETKKRIIRMEIKFKTGAMDDTPLKRKRLKRLNNKLKKLGGV